MVSYFVPRGRFLIKSINLRQTQKQQGKWPILRSFRQSSNDAKVGSLIKNTYTKSATTNNSNKDSAQPQQSHSVWVKWTGFLLRFAPVGILVYGAVEWQLHKQKCKQVNIPRTASEFQSKIYCSLPLRIMSRCWGWLAACYIPITFRPYIYGWYSNVFNVNLEEALYPDYKHYKSLQEFFTRPLRDGVRYIDPVAPLISPADGKVLHFGSANNNLIEQVKGVNYSIESFIGPPTWSQSCEGSDYVNSIMEHNDGSTALYQCVIYLAPGDYHRFHSPTQWQPTMRRHFSGELLSVNPKVAQWLPGLFCLNERALYIGKWQHGFFSYTAVGATNVGSVQIYVDDKLKTNRWLGFNVGAYKKRQEYDELRLQNHIELEKGDLIGQFNMGSTIVLLFEAPKNFKFNIQPGQKIYVGQPIGSVVDE